MGLKKVLVLLIIFGFVFSIVGKPNQLVNATIPSNLTKSLSGINKVLQSQNGYFTENKGQWNQEILFAGDSTFGSVAFAKDGVYYQLIKKEKNETTYQSQTVKLSFVNQNDSTITGENQLAHFNNYLIGKNQSQWQTNCRNYEKISFQNVWKGIDLAYFFTPEGIKYEFYLQPNANVRDIQIQVKGANLSVENSNMQIDTSLGFIQDTQLKVYDKNDGSILSSSFVVNKDIYSFVGIPETRLNPIVIDPLLYSTYLGGSQNDQATSIAVDTFGCAYVAGFTNSTLAQGFPVGDPIWFDTTFGGQTDAFVTKLNSSGTGILYSTYIGGTKDDRATSIAVDSSGCAFISGDTHSSQAEGFPVGDPIWFDTSYSGNNDAYIAKLNPSGTGLIYASYIGGSQNDQATSIAVDTFGCAYVAGFTNSTLAQGFPVGDPIWFDTSNDGQTDAFVTKFNPGGTGLVYSTYIGGSRHDQANSIAVDSFGCAYIAGYTSSTLAEGFPVGDPIWFDTTYGGNNDAFVFKLNQTGTSQLYGTYIGGSENDSATSITVDAEGNAYIAGFTDSAKGQGFPVGDPIWFDTTYGGNTDAFVTKLNTSGTIQIFGTYIGGSQHDQANSLQIDISGNILIAGYTNSTLAEGFPVGDPIWFDTTYGGNTDAFITKLNPSGLTQLYGSYIGGTQDDRATAIAIDSAGCAYVAGYTNSTLAEGFPVGDPIWFDTSYGGTTDAFVTKFSFGSIIDPGSPNSPQGNRVDNSSIQLSWQAAAAGSFPIEKYAVYKSTTDQFATSTQVAEITNLANLTWIDNDADHKTTYYYWITTKDNVLPTPNESTPSLMVTLAKQVFELIAQASPIVDVSFLNRSGQRTGNYHGSFVSEIPNSFMNPGSNSISILSDSKETFSGIRAQIEGIQDGFYEFSLSIVDYTPAVPQRNNIYLVTGQPILTNQEDLYEPDWLKYLAGQPFQVDIKKDTTGDGIFDLMFLSPTSPPSLQAILDFDEILLRWTPSLPSTYPLRSYRVFRSLNNQTFTFIGETLSTAFTDSTGQPGQIYYYYVSSVDSMNQTSPFSPVAFAGPLTQTPQPEIDLSVELNKVNFNSGEDVIYKVTITNSGFREAFDAVLQLTLPSQISYQNSDLFFGEAQPNGQVIFRIGTLWRRSTVTFQINARIVGRVIQETTATSIFDLQARNITSIRRIVSILLLQTKTGTSEQKISVVFKNLHFDTETGTYYLNKGETLLMDVSLDSFTLPYSIKITWGDGTLDSFDGQTETSRIFSHLYSSSGTMSIKVTIVDAVGRTKEVNLRVQVR